ncbi:cytochrome P450 [Rhizodiscina lignyota]|uniref:Cytochrome P450 n=1 Tax=Rhizodiscina lignyota TaxID=1504668 RepID=A0A9P4IMC4_9PEZI|nr:cytochrome P450 [Rhizodiscina lignyota]
MIDVSIFTLALAITGAIAVYRFLIYPSLLSPLSKIPNAHPTASISSAWIFWIRYQRRELATIHAAHQKLGPVIRLGPREISVNSVKGGIQTVYSGGFEKGIPEGNWYQFFTNFNGTLNMFSMARNKTHSTRKRMLSNIYSKSSLQSSRAMTSVTTELLNKRFIPALQDPATEGSEFNLCAVFSGITMDFVTGYQFGLAAGSNLTQNVQQRDHFLNMYISRQDYSYWSQEWPELSQFVRKFGYDLTPQHVYKANKEIETWALGMCGNAAISLSQYGSQTEKEADSPANYPVVYAQTKFAMDKEASKTASDVEKVDEAQQRLEIASEMLDHLAAGFDTSGITLTFLAQELSRPENASIQTRLREELQNLELDPETKLPNAKVLDAAPFLHAVLYETLRLHAAIPGPQPRTTPHVEGGSTLGPDGEYTGIPGGVRISAQAWSLHRNADVFPEPESFKPERWLVETGGKVEAGTTGEMNRWFWAFGSGGRMCVGSNLAIYQMKYIIYAIWANFKTRIVDDSECVQKDAYTAPPKGHSLIVSLEKAR